MSLSEFTFFDIFTGAGGLALGIESSGFRQVGCLDNDVACVQTIKTNRPAWNFIDNDVRTVDFKSYQGKVSLLTGGFPCQAFSYAGELRGFKDSRGTLFQEFSRAVSEIKPMVFLAENVKGLLTHDKGNTFKVILDTFSKEYNVEYRLLNAAYFGVGQKRERLFIIGVRKDLNISIEFPQPYSYETTLYDAIKASPPPSSPGITYSESKRRVLELVPPGGCWVDLPEDIAAEYMGVSYYKHDGGYRGVARRTSFDKPCPTLTCSPSQKRTELCHPTETRPFTVREYARIQSFPDDWVFCGSLADQYKQIGNAVPVKMAARLGNVILRMLHGGNICVNS